MELSTIAEILYKESRKLCFYLELDIDRIYIDRIKIYNLDMDIFNQYQTLLRPLERYMYTIHRCHDIYLEKTYLQTIVDYPILFPGIEIYVDINRIETRLSKRPHLSMMIHPGVCNLKNIDYKSFEKTLKLLKSPPISIQYYQEITPYMVYMIICKFNNYKYLSDHLSKESYLYKYISVLYNKK